jgi:hypothetical protein
MGRVSASGWAVFGAAGLVVYVAMLAVFLLPMAGSARAGDFASTLNAQIALPLLAIGAIPSLVLAGLLFVQRTARLLMAVAAAWLLINAGLWFPVQGALAAWAMLGAAVLLLGSVLARSDRQVGSTWNRPHR